MKKNGKNKLILTIAVVLLLTIGVFSGCVEDTPETGKIRYGGQYYPGEFLLQGSDFWG